MSAATGGVQVGAPCPLAVEQRQVDFQEAFINLIFAAAILVVAGRPVAAEFRIEQRIGGIILVIGADVGHARAIGIGVHAVEFAAIFAAERHRERPRPQFDRFAREVGADHILCQLGMLERAVFMRRDIGQRRKRWREIAEDVHRGAAIGARHRVAAHDGAIDGDRVGGGDIPVLQHDVAHADVGNGDAMLIIGVIVPIRAAQAELPLQPANEPILLAVGIDLRVGQLRVGGPEIEAGDAGRCALVADRLRQEGIVALDGQVRPAIAGAGLVIGLHLRDVDGDIGFIVVGEIIADAGIAVDALQRGFERGPRPGRAGQVAALAEAVACKAIADPAIAERLAVRAILELIGSAIGVEGDALERAVVDQAIARILVGLGIVAIDILRQPIVGLAGVEQGGGPVPVAAAGQVGAEIAGVDAAFMVIFATDDEMQPPIQRRGAIGPLHQRGFIVAIFGDAAQDIALEPFEPGVGDEIDHAAHGVRPIGGGGAAGHHVDALHQQLREHRNVGNTRHVRADDALPVEQCQGADGAKAAQREGAEALLAARRAERAGRGARRPLQRRQLRDGVEHIGLRIVGDLFLADDRGGCWRIEAAGGDARSRDDDVGGARRRSVGGILRRGDVLRGRGGWGSLGLGSLGLGHAGQRHGRKGGQAGASAMPRDECPHLLRSFPVSAAHRAGPPVAAMVPVPIAKRVPRHLRHRS